MSLPPSSGLSYGGLAANWPAAWLKCLKGKRASECANRGLMCCGSELCPKRSSVHRIVLRLALGPVEAIGKGGRLVLFGLLKRKPVIRLSNAGRV